MDGCIFNQVGYQSGPTGLVSCAEPIARIAVKILVKQIEIFKMRVFLKQLVSSVERNITILM